MNTEIPIEASSFEYVPESLKDKEGAPKFTIRYGTRRDRHKFQQELARRGVVSHSDEEIRATLLLEMKRLSQNTPEAIAKMTDTAELYWRAGEEFENAGEEWLKDCAELRAENPEATLPAEPVMDFDAEEEAWITNIIKTVSAQSTLIGNMNADNVSAAFERKEAALAAALVSVEGFELVRRHDGMIEADSLIALENWLGDKAEALGLTDLESVTPYMNLRIVAELAFHLPKVAEKNFAAPPPTISSPINSTPLGAQTDGIGSKASAKSKDTPKSNSPTPITESSTLPSTAETDGETSTGPTGSD